MQINMFTVHCFNLTFTIPMNIAKEMAMHHRDENSPENIQDHIVAGAESKEENENPHPRPQ